MPGRATEGAAQSLFVRRLDGDGDPIMLPTRDRPAWARVSPDGRWLAWVEIADRDYTLMVGRFPDLAGRQRVASAEYVVAEWDDDSETLYYTDGDEVFRVRVDSEDGETLNLEEFEQLDIPGPAEGQRWFYIDDIAFDVLPSGDLLMFQPAGGLRSAAVGELRVVEGWEQEFVTPESR